MEQQKLPNSTLILIFGILSIITCCCWGIPGLIFGIIAFVMSKKATELYLANPEQYSGYQNVKTGKILAIIGIVLSAIYFIYIVYLFATVGYEGIMEMNQQMMEQYGM